MGRLMGSHVTKSTGILLIVQDVITVGIENLISNRNNEDTKVGFAL